MDILIYDTIKYFDTVRIIDTVQHIDTIFVKNIPPSNQALNDNYFLGLPIDIAKFLIPSLLTLFLFFLGQFISWIKSKLERKNEIESIKYSVESWIELIKSTVINQINANRQFINLLRQTDEIIQQPIGFYSLLIDNLKDYKFHQFVETFVINCSEIEEQKINSMYNLINGIVYFSNYEQELRKIYNLFTDETINLMNEWSDTLRKMEELKKKYISLFRQNSNHPSTNYYKTYYELTNKWIVSDKNKESLNEINNFLIIPLLEKAKESVFISIDDQMAIDAIDILTELQIINKKWNKNRLGTIELFYSNTIDALHAYKGLKMTVNYTRNIKLKNIFSIK